MSLNWTDRFYIGGLLSATFTGAAVAGTLGMGEPFTLAAGLTYGAAAATGAGLGLRYMAAKYPSEEEEEQRWKEENPWKHKKDHVMTEEEQNEAFGRFMKKSFNLLGGLSLGAAGGFLAAYLVTAGIGYFRPAPPPVPEKPAETIKDIRDLGYWNR